MNHLRHEIREPIRELHLADAPRLENGREKKWTRASNFSDLDPCMESNDKPLLHFGKVYITNT